MIDLVLENQVLMSNFVRPSRKRGRENGTARERLVCKKSQSTATTISCQDWKSIETTSDTQ